jgi:carbamoyltransferase
MLILGINSAYHESSAAILVDGKLVQFLEEERINRIKHGKISRVDNPHDLPLGAIKYCLDRINCTLDEIDFVGFSFSETGRLKNIGVDTYTEPESWGTPEGERKYHKYLQQVPTELEKLGTRPLKARFRWVPHHLAHAASSFLCSPYEKALVLAIDGIGEFDSLWMGHGRKNELQGWFSFPYPHSLGFLWEKFCKYLGFTEYDACKVMGLASYGDPSRFAAEFSQVAYLDEEGAFNVNNEIMKFRAQDFSGLEQLFGKRRQQKEPIEQRHKDVAAVLQKFSEDAVLNLVKYGRDRTKADYLCLSGGVALNCLVNAKLERETEFDGIFIPPAAHDAGTALGAALYLWCHDLGRERNFFLNHAYWGPEYSETDIKNALEARQLEYSRLDDPPQKAAELVAGGKIVGWFQGKMEMGPRALGNRSLLADPRRPDMREILNLKIKHREPFRPFAPSVLIEKASQWFDFPGKTPSADYMLFAYSTKPDKREKIPAVIHVDGTSRIQTVRKDTNPLYHRLISIFENLTGVPMVLNTSFNDSEPIVMSPENAVNTFLKTGIDVLIMNDFLVEKK